MPASPCRLQAQQSRKHWPEWAALEPEHHRFGVGEVPEGRPLRTLEIFRRLAVEIRAEKTRNPAIRVDDHERPSAARQIAPERPCEPDELLDVPAIDQLRARD